MNSSMKYCFAIVMLFSPFHLACADGPTTISGKNESGEIVMADVEENYVEEPVATPSHPRFERWSIRVTTDLNKESHIYEKQYCGFTDSLNLDTWSFSCAAEGTSPLAGVTYVFDKRVKLAACEGYPFVCKSGCNARAPKLMIKAYWECSEDE